VPEITPLARENLAIRSENISRQTLHGKLVACARRGLSAVTIARYGVHAHSLHSHGKSAVGLQKKRILRFERDFIGLVLSRRLGADDYPVAGVSARPRKQSGCGEFG